MKSINQNQKKMKKLRIFSGMVFIALALMFTACEKNPVTTDQDDSILPKSFKVDIPDAISREASSKKSAMVDTLKGNQVYTHLATFINIGEEAADIVQDIIESLRQYHVNQAMSFSFEGDDGRTKNLVVVENSEYDDRTWEFELTISDADGEHEGGIALQVFWNRDPVEGIALVMPYNCDRNKFEHFGEARFRIDYNSIGDRNYDAWMMVQVADLPDVSPLEDPYAMKALKMFVGQEGDYVDVYGNSDHPNARFFTMKVGFNWAFVASGQVDEDIAAAEVGLPPSNLDEPSREVLLGYYSVHNVLMRQIKQLWPGLDQTMIAAYLNNTEAPAFFDHHGFVSGGDMPGDEWAPLVNRINVLSPYNPKEIHNLEIHFKIGTDQ